MSALRPEIVSRWISSGDAPSAQSMRLPVAHHRSPRQTLSLPSPSHYNTMWSDGITKRTAGKLSFTRCIIRTLRTLKEKLQTIFADIGVSLAAVVGQYRFRAHPNCLGFYH